MRIFKYQLRTDAAHTDLELPAGARILDIQLQDDELMLWALVNPDAHAALCTFRFELIPTGGSVDVFQLTYLATVQRNGLVLHVFVRTVDLQVGALSVAKVS